jgi:hypothetical protein
VRLFSSCALVLASSEHALFGVNHLVAHGAFHFLVHLVGKNFPFLATVRTLDADFGQTLVALESWTMLISHGFPPLEVVKPGLDQPGLVSSRPEKI